MNAIEEAIKISNLRKKVNANMYYFQIYKKKMRKNSTVKFLSVLRLIFL